MKKCIRISPRYLIIPLLLLLEACNLAPEFQQPQVPLPDNYSEQHLEGATVANLPWWEIFLDQKLQVLLKEGLNNNRDIGLALARIEESKAILGFVRSDQFPFLNLKSALGRGDLGLETAPASALSLLGDLTFEVDLWSKFRNATQAQRSLLLSNVYNLQTITISLISQIADLYFALIDLDNRITITRETVKNRAHSKDIISKRLEKGITTELELNQAQVEEITVNVNLIALEREQQVTEHALLVLLGKSGGQIDRSRFIEPRQLVAELPATLPATLLERRPDLLALEQNIRAQLSLEGVTEAQRLPSLQILGTLGLASTESTDIFGNDTQSWSIGGNLFSPLLNYGKNQARVEAQQARVEQSKQIYEAAVLGAVREVEDALIEIQTYNQEFLQRQTQIKVAINADRLSWARYDNGIASYLEVLDIERSRYNAELSASFAFRRYFNSLAKLYRALGGGWDPATV